MFKKIAPQVAEDSDGFIVQVGGRYTVQYVDGNIQADMEVDFGPTTAIYPSKLKACRKDGTPIELTPDQKSVIVKRIKDGLKALGVKYEVYT